jgi:hypothetical protein
MTLLHTEPMAPAFARLLSKKLEPLDYLLLVHVFEEISVLALHHLIPEALIFDAFAFDLYWDELREDVLRTRQQTGNEKFCENFEIAAERARIYRNDRPPKHRWLHKRGDGGSDEPPPDEHRPRGPRPSPASPVGDPTPTPSESRRRF